MVRNTLSTNPRDQTKNIMSYKENGIATGGFMGNGKFLMHIG